MPVLATVLGLSLLGSCGGLLVASSLLLFNDSVRRRLVPGLVSYAVGALLGVALLNLLPEALMFLAPGAVFATLLGGILVFFVLEKLVLIRHCHTDACQVHGATAALVIIGDAFHNFIDGAIICTAVLVSVPLGINTAIAVAAHEIPQEVGDVAILLGAGYSRRRALLLNLVSGASGLVGALVAFGTIRVIPTIRPFVLAFSSASLLYIAMSDLIPDLHRGQIDVNSLRQVLLIMAGIATIVVFGRLVDPMTETVNLITVEKMWRREVEAAHTYKLLAERERDPKRRGLLLRMAEQEDKHAARWAERIALTTGRPPNRREVERGITWFQKIGDPTLVFQRLEQEESQAEAEYDQLLSRLTNPTDRQIAEEAMVEEREHGATLRVLAGGPMPTPRSALDTILRRERWHARGTGWIGDAIYGVNDGLGAVFGIVSGMAGYTGGSEVVLAAGLAGTLASALSMGAGAYLASKAQREVYESEISRERKEIEENPDEELVELELFYQLKGFSAEEARSMAERLQKKPKQFLRALVQEELGLSEETFPHPWRSTLSATVSTAVGGFVPIIPFFFTVGMPAVVASFIISTAAHFGVGAAKSLVTTRSWWASGAEMTAVGIIEAAITYSLGLAFAGHPPTP